MEQARRSNIRLDISDEDPDGEVAHVVVTGDELRQRAAEWYRLRPRCALLEEELAASVERGETLVAILGETGDQASRATRRLREMTTEKHLVEKDRAQMLEELDRLRKTVEELEDVYVCHWIIDPKNPCDQEFTDVEDFTRHVRDHHCTEEALPETVPSTQG